MSECTLIFLKLQGINALISHQVIALPDIQAVPALQSCSRFKCYIAHCLCGVAADSAGTVGHFIKLLISRPANQQPRCAGLSE